MEYFAKYCYSCKTLLRMWIMLCGFQHGFVTFRKSSICGELRANFDYGDEVHQSRMLGAWSSMIGYITGFSLVGFYTMAETFLVENFKYGCKMSWLLDMTTIPRGSLLMSSFVDNLKPSYEKLALWGHFTLRWRSAPVSQDFIPRHGYLRWGMVCQRRWKGNKIDALSYASKERTCYSSWSSKEAKFMVQRFTVTQKTLTSEELPFKKNCHDVGNHVIFSIHVQSYTPKDSWP